MTKFRGIRLQKKVSLRHIARETGLSERYISFLDKGQRRPSLQVAREISQILNEPIEKIF